MRQRRKAHVSQKLLDHMLHHAAVSLRTVRQTDPERPVKDIVEPILRFNKIQDTSLRWTDAYWFIVNRIEDKVRELAMEPVPVSQPATPQPEGVSRKIRISHRRNPEIDEINKVDKEYAADLSVEIRPVSRPLSSGHQRAREGSILPPPKERDDA